VLAKELEGTDLYHNATIEQEHCDKHGERLHTLYQEARLYSTFQVIAGAGHGDPEFSDSTRKTLTLNMLKTALQR